MFSCIFRISVHWSCHIAWWSLAIRRILKVCLHLPMLAGWSRPCTMHHCFYLWFSLFCSLVTSLIIWLRVLVSYIIISKKECRPKCCRNTKGSWTCPHGLLDIYRWWLTAQLIQLPRCCSVILLYLNKGGNPEILWVLHTVTMHYGSPKFQCAKDDVFCMFRCWVKLWIKWYLCW